MSEPPEPRQRPLDFRLVARLFGYTIKYRGLRNALTVLVLLRSIQIPALAWGIGAIINGPVASGDTRGLWLAIAAYSAFAIVTEIGFHYRSKLALRLGDLVMHDQRAEVFRHLMRMPMAFYHETKLGRIISRITSDIEAIRVGVQDVFFVTIVQLGQMIVSGILMFLYEPALFLLVAGIGPILWFLTRYFQTRIGENLRSMQESFSRVTSNVAESISGIRVTQGFSREAINASIFRGLVADHSRYNIGAARTTGVFFPLLELNAQLFIALLLVVGGWRAMDQSIAMPVNDLVLFFFLANLFFQPIQVIGNQYNAALTAMAGAERLFSLLDTPPQWSDAEDATVIDRIDGRVEFRSVTFGYAAGDPVLKEVSFIAEPGQTIALVGHTGSGKSSIINLVAKFYLAQRGAVEIDGRDIKTITGDSIHRQMGIVQQHNFLFTGTVRENICLCQPSATDADIEAVCNRLGCLDEIRSIGLGTSVTEQGAGISLGQRQLVCIARAMLADPRILILDEATSAVDTFTERRIQRALGTLLQGRTSFVVAHRLSTIRNADLVLVLDHGRIIESGTHFELLLGGGTYARLYREFLRGE